VRESDDKVGSVQSVSDPTPHPSTPFPRGFGGAALVFLPTKNSDWLEGGGGGGGLFHARQSYSSDLMNH